jgi:hypothetical protein
MCILNIAIASDINIKICCVCPLCISKYSCLCMYVCFWRYGPPVGRNIESTSLQWYMDSYIFTHTYLKELIEVYFIYSYTWNVFLYRNATSAVRPYREHPCSYSSGEFKRDFSRKNLNRYHIITCVHLFINVCICKCVYESLYVRIQNQMQLVQLYPQKIRM